MGEYELWLWRLTGWTAQLAAAGAGVYMLLRIAFSRAPRWRAADQAGSGAVVVSFRYRASVPWEGCRRRRSASILAQRW